MTNAACPAQRPQKGTIETYKNSNLQEEDHFLISTTNYYSPSTIQPTAPKEAAALRLTLLNSTPPFSAPRFWKHIPRRKTHLEPTLRLHCLRDLSLHDLRASLSPHHVCRHAILLRGHPPPQARARLPQHKLSTTTSQ
jgi:hypothetical protein